MVQAGGALAGCITQSRRVCSPRHVPRSCRDCCHGRQAARCPVLSMLFIQNSILANLYLLACCQNLPSHELVAMIICIAACASSPTSTAEALAHACFVCCLQVKDSAMLSKIQAMVGTSSPLGATVAQIRDRLTAVTR